MIAWGQMVRSLIVGMAAAVLAIGLIPFLLVNMMSDLYGLIELDATPIYYYASKFIHWGE